MAEKRMISNQVIDTDLFLDMPATTQNLYFHLNLKADDDGFNDKYKTIMRNVRASEDDLMVLKVKGFILDFENGVIVIRHWRINNYLRKDRYKETQYLEEKSQLNETQNGIYELKNTLGTPLVYQMDTQSSIEEISIDKNSIDILVDFYNSTCTPKISKLTDARKKETTSTLKRI